MPETKVEIKRAYIFGTIFVVLDHGLLLEAGTEEVREVLRASTAVQAFVVSDLHGAQLVSYNVLRKDPFSTFFE